MDRKIENKNWKRKYIYFTMAGAGLLAFIIWLIASSQTQAVKVSRKQQTIGNVTKGLFKDYVRLNGQVVPIQIVQVSPEEGGIVQEKVIEEGSKVRKGDIILFYRSKDRKSIQCMGIVEDVLFSENIDEVFPTIAKRTVYSYSDLLKILEKKTLVILFRYIALDKEISYQQIAKAKVEGYIQSIRKIDNQQYSALIHEN